MPKYEVEQYEIYVSKYRIEAASAAEAIQKLFDGEIEPVDGSLEYVETAEDIGLPVDEIRLNSLYRILSRFLTRRVA